MVEMGGFEPPSRTGRTTQGDSISRLCVGSYRYSAIPDPVKTKSSPYGETCCMNLRVWRIAKIE